MPGPLAEARVLFHLIIEQKSLFVSLLWSQTSTQSFLLPAIFHGIHVGWEQRQCVWGLLVALVLIALDREAVHTDLICSCL
jgi:hypothetical protein